MFALLLMKFMLWEHTCLWNNYVEMKIPVNKEDYQKPYCLWKIDLLTVFSFLQANSHYFAIIEQVCRKFCLFLQLYIYIYILVLS